MKGRSRFVLLGSAVATFALVGIVSVTTDAGGHGVAPAATAVDPQLVGRVKGCIDRALEDEKLALRLLRGGLGELNVARAGLVRTVILRAKRSLVCVRNLLDKQDRFREIENGNAVLNLTVRATSFDTRAVDYATQMRKALVLGNRTKAQILRFKIVRELQDANREKSQAFDFAGDAPPAADNECEGGTGNNRVNEDEDDIGFRCAPVLASARSLAGRGRRAAAPVNEVEISARKPITKFSSWTVFGNNEFRTGTCTRLASSLVKCRFEPAMQPGQIFVVSLGGLGSGTPLVLQIGFGNRAQYIRLTTT